MQTIAQRWTTFEATVIPPEASPFQRKAMRLAFYAGFFGALIAGNNIADEAGDNYELGSKLMDQLYDECQQFNVEIQQGSDRHAGRVHS